MECGLLVAALQAGRYPVRLLGPGDSEPVNSWQCCGRPSEENTVHDTPICRTGVFCSTHFFYLFARLEKTTCPAPERLAHVRDLIPNS